MIVFHLISQQASEVDYRRLHRIKMVGFVPRGMGTGDEDINRLRLRGMIKEQERGFGFALEIPRMATAVLLLFCILAQQLHLAQSGTTPRNEFGHDVPW